MNLTQSPIAPRAAQDPWTYGPYRMSNRPKGVWTYETLPRINRPKGGSGPMDS
jgi:hypothetical protein